MTAELAITLIKRGLCFSLFLQALEMLWLIRSSTVLKVWNYQNLKEDFYRALPLPSKAISSLFSDRVFPAILVLQIIAAFLLCFAPAQLQVPTTAPVLSILLILFFTHLCICLRFRGLFNGGSDVMTFIIITGLLLTCLPHPQAQAFGLIYIAIHGLYSYFRAGQAKLIRPEWRNGTALPAFLSDGLYLDMRKLAGWLAKHKGLCMIACWSVLIFELSSVLIPFLRGFAVWYFLAAMVFHLVNYVTIGLNRFFWIWLCVWPAIFYIAELR